MINYADNIVSDESLAQYEEEVIEKCPVPTREKTDKQEMPDYRDMYTVADNCAFIQHCRDDATCLPEPEWWSMISILCHGENGSEICHEYSSAYPKYRIQETQQKIIAAQKENKPHTCGTIKEYGFCPSGGCVKNDKEVISPIAFANIDYAAIGDWELDEAGLLPANTTPISKEAMNEIKQKSIEDFFSTDKLNKLVAIKWQNSADYEALKVKCVAAAKKHSIMKDVVKRIAELEKQQLQQQIKINSRWDCEFFQSAEIPERYAADNDGVYYIDDEGDKIKIIATPIAITKKKRNINTHKTQCELTYQNYGSTMTKSIAPSDLAYRTIMELNNFHIPIANQYAKLASDYLLTMYGSRKIPAMEESDRYGWNNDFSGFVPYVAGVEVSEQMKTMNDRIESAGNYDAWKTALTPFRQSMTHRFALACGFAAPLYKPLGERIPVYMLWGEKDAGKSISVESLASIWGNPKNLCHTPNDSPAFIYRKAAMYNNIPLIMDELGTILNNADKVKDFKSIIYQLTQGQDPGRARKEERETREMNEWCTCIVVAGERGILSTEDFGGITKRVVEIEISSKLKKTNEKILSVVKKTTEKNYGHAGEEYIRKILPLLAGSGLKNLREKVVAQMDTISDGKYYYTDVVSIVLLADYLASVHIFQQAEDTAWAEMQELFKVVYDQYDELDADTEANNKYDVLLGWVEKNQKTFDGSGNSVVNGYFVNEEGSREQKEAGCDFSSRITFDKADSVVILASVLRDMADNQKQWGYKRLLADLRKIGVVADKERAVVDTKQQRVVQVAMKH